ncbi:MAG: hypothetical protein ACYC4U_11385 [Pirellulaceae bacterium]
MATFDDDFAVADAAFAEAFGDTVSIHRGALSTAGVTAEATSRDYEVNDTDGFITTIHSRDYVIDVAEYQISAAVVQPRGGDRIKESIGGTTHVFEVTPLTGRPCAEWSATQKPQWLIHTKLIGTE